MAETPRIARVYEGYGHDPARFEGFADRYRQELAADELREPLDALRASLDDGPLTLLTATNQIDLSHLGILAKVLAGSTAGAR